MIFSYFRKKHHLNQPTTWDYIELGLHIMLIAIAVGFILTMKSRYSSLFLHFI